ncbi:hypothetical protein AB0L40_14090 [Patulibacter sp. NPDC049589]|uniref:hypothetical protein n=1 Tax=Patulibacter sp. NPDC049589 TaxID=3154731 RepID=UPI0034143163
MDRAIDREEGWRALLAVAATRSQNPVLVREHDASPRESFGRVAVEPVRSGDPDRLIVSVDGTEQFAAEWSDLAGGWLETLDGADYFWLDLDFGWGVVMIGDEVLGHRDAPPAARSWTARPRSLDAEDAISLLAHIAASPSSSPVSVTWRARQRQGRLSIDDDLFTVTIRLDDRVLLRRSRSMMHRGWADLLSDGRRALRFDTGAPCGPHSGQLLTVVWGTPESLT